MFLCVCSFGCVGVFSPSCGGLGVGALWLFVFSFVCAQGGVESFFSCLCVACLHGFLFVRKGTCFLSLWVISAFRFVCVLVRLFGHLRFVCFRFCKCERHSRERAIAFADCCFPSNKAVSPPLEMCVAFCFRKVAPALIVWQEKNIEQHLLFCQGLQLSRFCKSFFMPEKQRF